MLPKTQKLDKKLFDEIFKSGRNYHSDFLFLKLSALENSDGKSRFAVAVPKKIAKKATARNLIKRRIFAVLRENNKQIKTGFGGIFFVKKGIERLEFKDYEKEVFEILKKARIII